MSYDILHLLTLSSKPKTYLVPDRERTDPPPRSPWGWLIEIFRFRDREVIKKCGLDAYFFLRYLQTLLIIFIPAGVVILPILLPLNKIGGRGPNYANEVASLSNGTITNSSAATDVKGLDVLAWGNVRPDKTQRYWTHLVLALLVIVWVCGVFFAELRVYIKVRQDYLTSAEHRLRASATTVLVSAIPRKWLTTEALAGLYDVFPGGIRNIWINRKFDKLLDKIHERDAVFQKLEAAETELVRKAKKAQREQLAKDEKLMAKQSKSKSGRTTKEDKAQKAKEDDAQAERLAHSGGVQAGDPHQVPHTIDDAIVEEQERSKEQDHVPEHSKGHQKKASLNIPIIGNGLAAVGQGFDAVGQGLGKGFGAVGKAGGTVLGGTLNVGREFNNQIETTNGFMNIDTSSIPDDDSYDEYGRYKGDSGIGNASVPYGSGDDDKHANQQRKVEFETQSPSSSHDGPFHSRDLKLPGNTTRKPIYNYGGDSSNELPRNVGWWKFWQGPAGGFASPIPTGYEEGDEFPLTQTDKAGGKEKQKQMGMWATIKSLFSDEEDQPIEYPLAYNPDYKEDAHGAVWEKYLKAQDRPTHRLPRFGWTPGFLPGLPLISPKVDTIYWCREQLARLNMEIEMDQKHPERFPLMNSAFIQFNHQVAAHMACQSVTHHVPKHMAPRTVEIAPKDVLWDNMSIKWWESWLRTAVVFGFVTGMVVLWAFPVAWTASLSQLAAVGDKYTFLHWLNDIPDWLLKALGGVLPALVLSILLALVPMILNYLAFMQGAQTGTEKERSVQNYYFAFLFVQVFLVVSISSGALLALTSATNITAIPETLATQLPKASNYFFSYMILQALSTSSGTLLQIFTLILWFIMPKLFDSTPRQKWARNTSLPTVTWGTFFPVYTNFACIGLIYIVVAPLIILFAIITFALLWIANRYNMLYVSRFTIDTGGLLYPQAINQTFVGLYVMELCLIGLFFLVEDQFGNSACIPQAIIMIVALVLTVLYQVLLNWSFGPLFLHLPITFEDEAVLRDEAFERAQARRLGLDKDDGDDNNFPATHEDAIEMSKLDGTHGGKFANSKFNPVNVVQGAGSWAVKSSKNIRSLTWGGNTSSHDASNVLQQTQLRKKKRPHRDVEAQKRIADALYGGYNDEIEDLTPEERDVLVRHAFQHYALRARRPTVWIPRDDIGVSDDEIQRTREYAGNNIWISNVGAALDSKSRVVYGKNPPDFSEIDLINL
jgi:hypothetical protein